MSVSMNNEKFGELVRALRESKVIYKGAKINYWTREKLALETQTKAAPGLTPKQIEDIERGRIKNLNAYYIEPLARAFGLNEAEKAEFYATAGVVYNDSTKNLDRNAIATLLKSIAFPATVRNSLWDFTAINQYNASLWGYSEEQLSKLVKFQSEANVLKVLFNPEYNTQRFYENKDEWRKSRVRDIRAFRAASFKSIHTDAYNNLLNDMMQYSEFEALWKIAAAHKDEVNLIDPVIKLIHPEYGSLELISLRVPQPYHRQNVSISVYVPTMQNFEAYTRFKEAVPDGNTIFSFPENEEFV